MSASSDDPITGELGALPPEPYPLRASAERALRDAATPPAGWQPLGYTAGDYLGMLRGICGYFRQHQDERGAIIDPYAGEEKQYATPCYAVAAALVALDGRAPAGAWGAARPREGEAPADLGLLESAARAQDHALRGLAVEKNTPQGHADFFAPLVVLGYQLLAPFVERSRAGRWLAELRSIGPESTYRNTFSHKRSQGQEETVHNWNVVALSGELLRAAAGAGSDLPWVERYLDYQLRSHADLEWGLYRDPNCPLPYDLFPRHHLGYALAAPGVPALLPELLRHDLAAWLHRGEWTSALTQTGSGGIPPGWRSSEHLWNDAALVALAETAARRHARAGRHVAAGLFRRVATLAFRSMLHWQRSSGELHVVKNHFDPVQRWGFEGYSFHSNYGLYPAAMLATAILFGDCETPEAPAPVETGSFVVRYPAPFHTLLATCRGLTLSFDLDADGKYDVTGLNSVRKVGEHPLLGPASGIPAQPRYGVPEGNGIAIGCGLGWKGAASADTTLAGLHPAGVDVRVLRSDRDGLEFTLRYALKDQAVTAVASECRLTGSGISMTERLEGGDPQGALLRWPLLFSDQRHMGEGHAGDQIADWKLGESHQLLRVDAGEMQWRPGTVCGRNGEYSVAETPLDGRRIGWRLEYE